MHQATSVVDPALVAVVKRLLVGFVAGVAIGHAGTVVFALFSLPAVHQKFER